ncbi:MAG TPA: hypothetical protein VK601_19510, partial [Kofleriaceae bacterium]|nr:hypothetical protein [Kofleriaceae bacterium]
MRVSVIAAAAVAALALAACGDNQKPVPPGGGMPGEGPVEVTCEVLPALTGANACSLVKGSATKLLRGNVLTPTTVYKGGQVAVDETGKVGCVGCKCAAGGETTITCPDAVISPGLINTHDHITFDGNAPYTSTAERYEHRHQWRNTGQDGHSPIPDDSSTNDQVRWAELRFVMGGATSIVGSGGQAGLLRNLDRMPLLGGLEMLGKKEVEFQTFPLDDVGGARRIGDCNYGGTPDTAGTTAVA